MNGASDTASSSDIEPDRRPTIHRVPRPWTVSAVLVVLAAPCLAAPIGERAAGLSLGADLLIVGLLILANGVFAMAEAALLTVRRTRIEQLVEEGNRSAKLVAAMLADPTRMLSTIQVGMTLLTLFSAGAAAENAAGPLAELFRGRFPGTPLAANAPMIAFVTVMLCVSLLTLIIGEITPKSIAVLRAEQISLAVAYPVRWLQFALKPIVAVVTSLSNLIVRPLGGTATFRSSAMSEEELKIMVEQSEELGVIESAEREMIHSIFEFADTTARKVMTPRLDISAVPATAVAADVVSLVASSGHSRLMVFDGDLDNTVGVIHVKDIVQLLASEGDMVPIRPVIRQPYFVPENKPVDDLLGEFRRNKTQLAIVRDEYGTVVGIVTIEDLLEEIVGDIQDEYDVEEPEIRQEDSLTCVVDGRMSIADFNDRMGITMPVDEADTVGGYVFGAIGHQPTIGERAEAFGLIFEVARTDGRRIQRVRVTRAAIDQPAGSTPTGENGGQRED